MVAASRESVTWQGLLLVEDDAFTRSTLTAALQRHGFAEITAVGAAAGALDVSPLPSLALLDLDLGPGPTGIDLAHALRDRHPTIGLVLLTTYDDPRLLSTDLPRAPRGTRYLSKRQVSDVTEVVTALRVVQRNPLGSPPSISVPLSDAQLDVLRGIAEGLSTAEIARRRGVSEKAVEKAITKLCEYFDLARLPSHNQRVRLAAEFYAMSGQAPR